MKRPAVALMVALGPAVCAGLAGVVARWPGKIPRVGLLSVGTDSGRRDPFRRGLRDLGWVEGQRVAAPGLTVPPSILLRADHRIPG